MFIDKLKVACAKKGTTPTALLKSMGMSTSSVTAWKKGVEPSVGTVYKLSQKLGCDPSDLLEGWGQNHLLGRARDEKKPTSNEVRLPDDRLIASYGEVKEYLSQEDIDDIELFMRMKAERKKKKEKENERD